MWSGTHTFLQPHVWSDTFYQSYKCSGSTGSSVIAVLLVLLLRTELLVAVGRPVANKLPSVTCQSEDHFCSYLYTTKIVAETKILLAADMSPAEWEEQNTGKSVTGALHLFIDVHQIAWHAMWLLHKLLYAFVAVKQITCLSPCAMNSWDDKVIIRASISFCRPRETSAYVYTHAYIFAEFMIGWCVSHIYIWCMPLTNKHDCLEQLHQHAYPSLDNIVWQGGQSCSTHHSSRSEYLQNLIVGADHFSITSECSEPLSFICMLEAFM